jgi:hypothetical protein
MSIRLFAEIRKESSPKVAKRKRGRKRNTELHRAPPEEHRENSKNLRSTGFRGGHLPEAAKMATF